MPTFPPVQVITRLRVEPTKKSLGCIVHDIVYSVKREKANSRVVGLARFVRSVSKLDAFGNDGQQARHTTSRAMIPQLPIAYGLLPDAQLFGHLLLGHFQVAAQRANAIGIPLVFGFAFGRYIQSPYSSSAQAGCCTRVLYQRLSAFLLNGMLIHRFLALTRAA